MYCMAYKDSSNIAIITVYHMTINIDQKIILHWFHVSVFHILQVNITVNNVRQSFSFEKWQGDVSTDDGSNKSHPQYNNNNNKKQL